MKRMVLFLVLVALLTSCATIINGTDPSLVSTTSIPAGAKVSVKGLQNGELLNGTTPDTFSLSRNSDYQFVFDLEGYQSKEVVVRRTVTGWFWGNLLLGGIIGGIVDYSTGAMWDHTMATISIDFSQAKIQEDYMIADMIIQYFQDGQLMHVKVPVIFEPKI